MACRFCTVLDGVQGPPFEVTESLDVFCAELWSLMGHFSDMPRQPDDVRSRGQSRHPAARPRLPFLTHCEVLGLEGERHKPSYRSVIHYVQLSPDAYLRTIESSISIVLVSPPIWKSRLQVATNIAER